MFDESEHDSNVRTMTLLRIITFLSSLPTIQTHPLPKDWTPMLSYPPIPSTYNMVLPLREVSTEPPPEGQFH